MLNIDNPTFEEAGACALIEGLMQGLFEGSNAKTPRAMLAMVMLGSNSDIDPRHAWAIIDKALELLQDMNRIGNKADELLQAAKAGSGQ